MSGEQISAYHHYRDLLKGQPLPLAFVDLDKFDRNLAYVAWTQRHNSKTIRIHTKSLRCLPLIKRILETGGNKYQGLMTFTTAETDWLAQHGLDDFIIAYPSVQTSDLKLLATMTRQGIMVSMMVDSVQHLEILNRAGAAHGQVLRACLDVDMSYRPLGSPLHLGVRRSPIRTSAQALGMARTALGMKWVKIDSVMGYEGHVAGPNDNLPRAWFKNRLVRAMKKASIREFTPRRVDIVKELKKSGLELRAVNGGGSGSLVSTGLDQSVTEITAGSAFFGPGLFRYYREVNFVPSAFFALQVVRLPAPGLVTCLGGGYVASGPPGPDRLPVPVLPHGLQLLPLEGAGEVQTPFKLPPDCPELKIGDPVFLQHAKAGELAERFNEFLLIQGDRLKDRAPTYRGQGQAFL